MAETILRHKGYKILTAPCAKDALELYAKHGSEIKVVLTDVSMPEMDGVALTRALKAMDPAITVIASTGQSAELRYKELQSLNVTRFLSKPYNAHQLLSVVHHAVSGTVP